MVELNEGELPILIGKAWALRDRLSCEINKTAPLFHDEEKQRLVGIRDSIKDVGDMLSSLQKLGERQRRCREAAETRLEESRARLMELAKRHRGTRALHIITEMEASFGERLSKANDCGRRRNKLAPRSVLRWMVRVVRVRIFDPIMDWRRSMWVAAKLVVLSLSISAVVMGRRRLEDFSGSNHTFTLDVFHARG